MKNYYNFSAKEARQVTVQNDGAFATFTRSFASGFWVNLEFNKWLLVKKMGSVCKAYVKEA